MLQYLFAEYETLMSAQPKAFHIVNIDPMATGKEYLQVRSAQSFKRRQQKHFTKSTPIQVNDDITWKTETRNEGDPKFDLVHIYTLWSSRPKANVFTEYMDKSSALKKLYELVPVIEHRNVWAFFKAIEYMPLNNRLKGKRLQTHD